jgi:hypothetical protein
VRPLRRAALGLLLLAVAPVADAQQILIDQAMRAEGLWCFPSADDPDHWYYVPMTARLAVDAEGDPVFSFLRYVVNRASPDNSSQGITQAEGGGIITLMATYDTPETDRRRAEQTLRRATGRETAVLRGPVIFQAGRYVLVSSILRESGDKDTRVLATGNAPVFEGNEVAFSFDVTPEQSKLLLESFKTATPDVSLVFEMTLGGLSDAFDALLTVNWQKVNESEVIGGGVSVGGTLGAADIEQGFEELRKDDAIQLVVRGSNPNMEALLDATQDRLLAMMFTRVEPEKAVEEPAGDEGGLGGLFDGLLGGIQETLSKPGSLARLLSPFGVSVNYQKKEVRSSGSTTIHFNNQAPVERNVTMVANIGDLYQKYAEDENRFRTVNLSDPAYQQREIHVGIDGAILPEFEKYINSVTVTLRKVHENGEQTIQEVVVDRNTFTRESRDFRMVYGWNEDADRDGWLEYDYRTRWSFKGGGLHETDWTKTVTNMIDLYAPYRRNTVEVIGDGETLRELGVRAVAVRVDYDFFDGRRSQELALPTSEPLDGREIEITLPLNVYEYDYQITWLRRGREPLVASGRDDTGVIFIDSLPPEPTLQAAEGDGG